MSIRNIIAVMLGADVVSREWLEMYDGCDFIPDAPSSHIDDLRFRQTTYWEVFQCCEQVGDDIQSGPMYCGKIADLVVGDRFKYIGLCSRHKNGCSERLKWATVHAKDNLQSLRN